MVSVQVASLSGKVSVTVRHDPTGGTTGTLKSFFHAELHYSYYTAGTKRQGFRFMYTLLLQLLTSKINVNEEFERC